MEPEIKKKNIALSIVLTACLILSLLIGSLFFARYLKEQVYEERTTQLGEVTYQLRDNLDRMLDSHWNYLAAAVNVLEMQNFETRGDVISYIGELEQLLATDMYNSKLMLLCSEGHRHDSEGKHGVWTYLDIIAEGYDRYAFISDSYVYRSNYWFFIQKLEEPIHTEQDDVTFTHVMLLRDVQSLTEYYDSNIYGDHNETYLLKSNGTRMYDNISGEKLINSYNVLKVLEKMEGQRYPSIRAAMSENQALSSNFMTNGEEYYYSIASLEEYDTMLLFLIPAKYVASGTVNMVNAIIRTLLIFAAVLLALLVLAIGAVASKRNSDRLFRQEQTNLHRLEEMNAQLGESNAMLVSAKEAAEQAFRIAEEANLAKSSFLSNMSHDIRTPMNAIIGFASLLMREVENPEKVREYTKKIASSGQHLLGLINDILDISKIEAGKTTLNLSDENIVNLIEDIDNIIRPQMKAKKHTFEVYNKDLRHEHVIMDKLRLNQILLNLLSNALKYTPDGGCISLTVQELPQLTAQMARYRFIVEDNGIGMGEEYLKILFQAFTREEDSVTNTIQGTGLGMAITKNLLDLMGGTISVESEKGEGSTFTVELSLHISEQEIDSGFWEKHGIKKILAVDDEEVICQHIQAVMSDAGVAVDYVLDGKTAIETVSRSKAENSPYDIVLMDWKMPMMDGLEAAKRIRSEIFVDTPIIILTSYDWAEMDEAETATHVDAFLSKPFFLTSFRQKVDMILNCAPEISETSEHSVFEGLHILAAEDNEINAEILTEILGIMGATCDIYENGQLVVDAFEKSAEGQYQLVLMDVQMPVMNGYQATRAIRALDHPLAKKIPIIAMTANAFAEDVKDALESGMNAHVAKPVDMAVLEQVVRTALSASSNENHE